MVFACLGAKIWFFAPASTSPAAKTRSNMLLLVFLQHVRPWKLSHTHYVHGSKHLSGPLNDFSRLWSILWFSHVLEQNYDSSHLSACLNLLQLDQICFLMVFSYHMRPWKLPDTHHVHASCHMQDILSAFIWLWTIWWFSHLSEPKYDSEPQHTGFE